MPGRQSHGPPSLGKSKSKPKRKQSKRALDALAIAEAETPRRTKIRQSRLGESEDQFPKRKRDEDEDGHEEDEAGSGKRRRRRGDKDRFGNEIEVGSDSSGNEWVIGEVGKDDDSDLDSDEAFGESDEEKFEGFAFGAGGKKSHKETPQSGDEDDDGHVDLRENGEEEESDGFAEDAVDLVDMLDGGGDESVDSDDGEGGEEEESVLSISEEEDDVGDSAKLDSLKALVFTMNKEDGASGRPRRLVDAQESATPSEYGVSSKRKLTVADLVPSVKDPKIRKSLKLLADDDTKSSGKKGTVKKLNVPLPKRQQNRLDRVAANEKAKETLNRWTNTIKHNRRADHLSFPLQDPNAVAAPGSQRFLPDALSKPITDLEKTIQSIMEESGLAPTHGKTEEEQILAFEELQANKMPLAEVQARRAELRRTRELLFREEIRAKRIKKIKSKTFRKVHRKERERNAQQEHDALVEAGVEESESEKERNDRRRAEERMGARHRESKWAKGVKESGRGKWDEDARGGVTEMARRGEELRQRIEGREVNGDEDGSDSFESDDADDDIEDVEENRLKRLSGRVEALRNGDNLGARSSGLADMDFMKKAEAARKARNDDDVERMRRDLAGEHSPEEDEGEEGVGRKSFGPTRKEATSKPANPFSTRQKSEFEARPGSDGEDESVSQEFEEDAEIITDGPHGPNKAIAEKRRSIIDDKNAKISANNVIVDELAANPWLSTSQQGSNKAKQRSGHKQAGAIISNSLLPAPAPIMANSSEPQKPRSALKGARNAELKKKDLKDPERDKVIQTLAQDSDNNSEADALPFVLRNKANIARAFAGDAVTTDFEKEKAALTEADAPQNIETSLPGWGSWTGAGLSRREKKHAKSRKTSTMTDGVEKEKRKDAKLSRVIISEKTVKKNRQYLASELPHPFETRQQYERSLRLPVGPEWTTKETFQIATKPRVLLKQGVITPMSKPLV